MNSYSSIRFSLSDGSPLPRLVETFVSLDEFSVIFQHDLGHLDDDSAVHRRPVTRTADPVNESPPPLDSLGLSGLRSFKYPLTNGLIVVWAAHADVPRSL
jgi:hypothetical protein